MVSVVNLTDSRLYREMGLWGIIPTVLMEGERPVRWGWCILWLGPWAVWTGKESYAAA